MSKQAGLSDRGRFEAFSSQWRATVAKEAEKWCSNGQSAQLLTDAVLADFRRKYAEKEPPRRLEYYLRAQVCLVYSQTGQSVRKLREYLAGQESSEEEGTAPEAEEPAAEMPATESAEAQPEPEAETQAAPAAQTETLESLVQAATVQAEDAVRPAEAAPPETAPASPSPSEDSAPKTPDTFLDPVRTSYWTPNEERSGHVVQEVELPDEEDEPRSVGLSFLNTVLFLVTAAAFGFCVYETGFLQYLLQ